MAIFQALVISLLTLEVFSSVVSLADFHTTRRLSRRQDELLTANQSVLPPGWSGSPQCFSECSLTNPVSRFLLGPSITNSTSMTIELCVSFCDQQGYLMAGLLGSQCRCSNIFNPATCFESDTGECTLNDPHSDDLGGKPCPGNPAESCGNGNPFALPPLYNVFFKGDLCQSLWRGGALFTSGPWRLVYFFNDTVGMRALPHNAVDLHPGLPRGNLTIESCVNACQASGFLLAGVEFADECYCGNSLEHNSQPIPECGNLAANQAAMRCKGDPSNFCGGPNLLYLYTLSGSGFTPLIPFDPVFDGFCEGCSEFGIHT